MGRKRVSVHRSRRRAAVVVQVAVGSTVLLGMGALAVDVGTMYMARTELQASADAAALAAASQLVQDDSGADPVEAARQAADKYARANEVLGRSAGLNLTQDVVFGRAEFDSGTGKFVFEPNVEPYDAVRVTVRRTSESEGGAIQLGFANIFGRSQKDLWASASAVLLPRDIAVVIDLSGSMNDDSELQHFKTFLSGATHTIRPGVEINLRDVWCALDGPAPSRPYVPGGESETEYAGDTGPNVGNMTNWGIPVTVETYDASTDPGLVYSKKGTTSTDSNVTAYLTGRGYSLDERNLIMKNTNDYIYTNHWRNRTAVMIGLADWKSGRAGGRTLSGGDGDGLIEDSEMTWTSYPSYRASWTWTDYINYVASSSTAMKSASSKLQYRFGLKTYTNFLLENQALYSRTNVLWQTPEEPLQAVKDAVQSMTDVIVSLQSLDQMSLESFATTARHEINLSNALQTVPDRLYQRQAGHFNSTTNIGGGIAQGLAELNSSRARGSSAKVIVLMSDGKPNIDENGNYVGDGAAAAHDYAVAQAQIAADQSVRVYTVSVGYDADRPLMQEIAAIAHGQEFYASGTVEEYTAELEAIFKTLGGKRPVALIE